MWVLYKRTALENILRYSERKAGSRIFIEGMRLFQRLQSCLLFCLKPKASAMALSMCHVAAVSGEKNNDYEDLHSGYALKQKV